MKQHEEHVKQQPGPVERMRAALEGLDLRCLANDEDATLPCRRCDTCVAFQALSDLTRADARQADAVPDLVSALEAVRDWAETTGVMEDGAEDEQLWQTVVAALVRANGKAP